MSGPWRWALPREGGIHPPPPSPHSPRAALRALLSTGATASRAIASSGVLRPARMPEFLGIGAQKSGTTWLHANLATHPEVFLPEAKELHWLDWNWHRGPHAYAEWFRSAGARLAGEITPAYGIAPTTRIDAAVRLMPGVKVIYLLRDPIERAWSQAVVTLERYGTGLGSEASLLAHLGSEPVIERSRHSRAIDRWSAFVPEERTFLGFFEEIADDPAALLERVLRFLGVDPNPSVESPLRSVVNRGEGTPMPDAARSLLVDRLGDELVELDRRFGGPATAWRRRWLG
jgi:hypothetical protein